MKITSIFEKEEITVSFEVFPPKTTTNYEAVEKAALGVAALKPSYMSDLWSRWKHQRIYH